MSFHDQCDEDDLPTYVELAMHTYEVLCDSARCNAVGPDYDATYCDPNEEQTSMSHGVVSSPPPLPAPPSLPSLWTYPPVWADALIGMSTWLVLASVVTIGLLTCIAKEVRGIREMTARRATAPIFSSIATQEGAGNEMTAAKPRPGAIV